MGWQPAQQASGNDWLAPFLAETLTDPYDVVRYIGGRSLGTLPGFKDIRYDFVGAQDARVMARDRVLTLWQSNLPVVPKSRREAILRTPAGMDRARFFDSYPWTTSLSASNIPFELAMAQREGLLRKGDLVAAHSGGSGIVVSGALMRWCA